MDELELIKAIPPEVAKAAYDDTISPALKETGKFGQDLVKTLRFALFSLQYTAMLQDRLAEHLQKSIERVPEDRRINLLSRWHCLSQSSLNFMSRKVSSAKCLSVCWPEQWTEPPWESWRLVGLS